MPGSGLNEDKTRVDRQRPHAAITTNVPVKGEKQPALCSINFNCKWSHVEINQQKRQISDRHGAGRSGGHADHRLESTSWA